MQDDNDDNNEGGNSFGVGDSEMASQRVTVTTDQITRLCTTRVDLIASFTWSVNV